MNKIYLGWFLLMAILFSLLAGAFAANAQVYNPPFPDAVVCTQTTEPFDTNVYEFSSYVGAGTILLYGDIQYDRVTGEYLEGASERDCEFLNLPDFELSTTTSPYALNYGYSTTTLLTSTVNVDNSHQVLFFGFIMFFITAGGVIWFFRKR